MILLFGISYFIIGTILFVINLIIFELITPFSVKKEIFDMQNKAVGKIIRGQLIGQGIMFGSLIYFLGLSYDHNLNFKNLFDSIISIISFGMLGIVLFQSIIFVISKIIPLQKEIIIDINESLAGIIEGLLIAMSIIISVSLYS